jgi:hypothetical protein
VRINRQKANVAELKVVDYNKLHFRPVSTRLGQDAEPAAEEWVK